jgi:hypothetical protein
VLEKAKFEGAWEEAKRKETAILRTKEKGTGKSVKKNKKGVHK